MSNAKNSITILVNVELWENLSKPLLLLTGPSLEGNVELLLTSSKATIYVSLKRDPEERNSTVCCTCWV